MFARSVRVFATSAARTVFRTNIGPQDESVIMGASPGQYLPGGLWDRFGREQFTYERGLHMLAEAGKWVFMGALFLKAATGHSAGYSQFLFNLAICGGGILAVAPVFGANEHHWVAAFAAGSEPWERA